MTVGSIDVDSIVKQLMAIERQPLTVLNSRKATAQTAVNTLNTIKTAVSSIQTAAAKLGTSSAVARYTATSSNPDAVAARVTGTAGAGSLTFRVISLAGSAATRSGTVADGTVQVTDALRLAVAAGTSAQGISSIRASDTTSTGTYSLRTTAAVGSGVQLVGRTTPGVPMTVTGGDNSFTMLVNGAFTEVTIAPGTYGDASEVASAVQAAVTAAGLDVTVGLDGGALSFTGGGSVTSLGVASGGSALTGLGLAGGLNVTGGAGVESNGATTAIAASVASGPVTIAAGGTAFDLNLAGPLTTGQNTVKVVDTGDRSLSAVASAISSASAGVSASAVNTGSGWLLQLGSNVSGTGGNIGIDMSALTLTGWADTGTAQNAVIQVGDGPGAYTVTAQGNTFTDVVAGVTITARQVTADPVTISVERNNSAVVDDVAALVSSVNHVLAQIKNATRWDPSTKTGGPLLGDSAVRRLAADVNSALSGIVGDYASGHVPGAYGIELQKDGTFKFDTAKFTAALEANPALADELLVGTTAAPGVAARLDKLSTELVHWETGLLTNTTKSAQDRITRFNEQIDRLTDRLQIRETNMYRQWASLSSMLGQMQNQGTWLQGQLANLPSFG